MITAVRFGTDGEVERVVWARVDGSTNKYLEKLHEVEVDRVVEAFDRGDFVEMIFEVQGNTVSGGRVVRKVLPAGHERITEAWPADGRTLLDLPRF